MLGAIMKYLLTWRRHSDLGAPFWSWWPHICISPWFCNIRAS